MKILPKQLAKFLSEPSKEICAILVHGNDAGLRSFRTNQLASLYSNDLDDVFSVTRISGESLKNDPSKIADAAAQVPMFGLRLVLVKAMGSELLEACKLLLDKPITDSMVIIDVSETTTKHQIVKLFENTKIFAAVACYADNDTDIMLLAQNIFREDNIKVDKDALKLISSKLGNDHATTRAELKKLALLAGPNGHLNFKAVSESLVDNSILTIDSVAHAVATGHVNSLSAALNRAWLEEANCIAIVRGCQTYFNHLRTLSHAINCGQSPSSAARAR